MKLLMKLLKLLVFGVGGVVACILLLGWALARHGEHEAPRPDLSNLASDTMHEDLLTAYCGGDKDVDKGVPGMPKFKFYRPHYAWMDCAHDAHAISESANQILRVEASGLQKRDMAIAVSLDADRRDLATLVKDFRAKWQPPVKK